MSEVKLDSERLDNAVESLRYTRQLVNIQKESLDQAIAYINEGFSSNAREELVNCINRVKSNLSDSIHELNKAADDINTYKGLISYIENMFL